MGYELDAAGPAVSSVPMADIAPEDTTFRLTTRCGLEDLTASIPLVGLMTPPLILPGRKAHIIVSGFRRIAACRQLGWERIPARRLDTRCPPDACARLAVAENSLSRPLNLIEVSRALNLLARFAPQNRTTGADAAALGLPSHPGLAAQLTGLVRLPEEVQAGVVDGTIGLAMAVELGRLSPPAAAAFAHVFRALKAGLNKQREILSAVVEIAAREDRSAGDVLQEPFLREVLEDRDMDRSRKTAAVRDRLRRRRYPAITRAEDNFRRLRRRLELGDRIRLLPPRDFEAPAFTLALSFEGREDIARLIATLNDLLGDPGVEELLGGKARHFGEPDGPERKGQGVRP
jgi:hypothetical protein